MDVQALPDIKEFNGLQQVTITDASSADMSCPNYLQQYEQWLGKHKPKHGGGECVPELVPVVALNATKTAVLDGFTMTAVSSGEGYRWGDKMGAGSLAIRVFAGEVSGVTILTGQMSGATDVRDYVSAVIPTDTCIHTIHSYSTDIHHTQTYIPTCKVHSLLCS